MRRHILIRPRGRRPPSRIEIGPGCFALARDFLARRLGGEKAFIITDSNVRRAYGRRLLAGLLFAHVDAWLIDFPAGEQSKNADLVARLHTQLLEHGVRRDSLIVALGGGVVGDVAGYVAATILRGIGYVQIPTTLLAQVDSSVGGKVGIDHPLGKNLIGVFHQPEAVFIDPLVLETLPVREYRAGLGEAVKIAAALDPQLFRFIERNTSRINKRDTKALTDLITRSVSLKAAIVARDELESGLRKTLNLGHTIGHALEAADHYTLRHGEAVAIGLATESKIARDMGLLGAKDHDRLLHLMRTLKLRTSFPPVRNTRGFLDALSADKKAVGSSAKFVLLERIGCTVVGVDVPTPFVTALLGKKR